MSRRRPCLPRIRQRGVALAVALILLVIITLLGLSAVRLSAMELRMSSNDELRVSASEAAGSLVDATISNGSNTPAISAGIAICARATAACSTTTVVLPPAYQADTDLNVVVMGVSPTSGSPPTGSGWSNKDYAAANLKISGLYDKTAQGWGQATVSEGLAVIYSKQGQDNHGLGPYMQSDAP